MIKRGEKLSEKLNNLYARELFIAGADDDFIEAEEYFKQQIEDNINLSYEELKIIQCVLTKCGHIKKDLTQFFKFALKNVAGEKPSAEVCYELGEYFYETEDYAEATTWYYNAAFETESELNIHYAGDYPLMRLVESYRKLGDNEQADIYQKLKDEWRV